MPKSQFDVLLEDPDFLKVVGVVASELAGARGMPFQHARGVVLSGLGNPVALAAICAAWGAGRRGLAKVMVRRRALDLLRKDARRPNHQSLPATVDELHDGLAAQRFAAEWNWALYVEHASLVRVVTAALECFAGLGKVEARRASLLRRYAIDDVGYAELSAELGVNKAALRVRVHEALNAFRDYLRDYLGARDPQLFHEIPTR